MVKSRSHAYVLPARKAGKVGFRTLRLQMPKVGNCPNTRPWVDTSIVSGPCSTSQSICQPGQNSGQQNSPGQVQRRGVVSEPDCSGARGQSAGLELHFPESLSLEWCRVRMEPKRDSDVILKTKGKQQLVLLRGCCG